MRAAHVIPDTAAAERRRIPQSGCDFRPFHTLVNEAAINKPVFGSEQDSLCELIAGVARPADRLIYGFESASSPIRVIYEV